MDGGSKAGRVTMVLDTFTLGVRNDAMMIAYDQALVGPSRDLARGRVRLAPSSDPATGAVYIERGAGEEIELVGVPGDRRALLKRMAQGLRVLVVETVGDGIAASQHLPVVEAEAA